MDASLRHVSFCCSHQTVAAGGGGGEAKGAIIVSGGVNGGHDWSPEQSGFMGVLGMKPSLLKQIDLIAKQTDW